MKGMKLKKGARFLARWPNTHFYYWCTLIEPAGEEWKIQFDDGTVSVVKKDDLHDSPPANARNMAGRVTRSSPTKNRKRPEEIRKSPARKVRKLFTEEENIRLGAELTDVKEKMATSGAAEVRPSLRERSASVSRETEDATHGAAKVRSSSRERSVSAAEETEYVTQSDASVRASSRERSVSVSKEMEDVTHSDASVRAPSRERSKEMEGVTHNTTDARSSLFKRSVSVTREYEDTIRGAAGIRSSPFKRSVSRTRETEDTGDIRRSPSRASISVTVHNQNVKHDAADVRSSSPKRSITVEIRKESHTHNVTRYTESYLDKDFRSRLLKEGSTDVSRYAESYLDRDFRRRVLGEGSVGSADLRPSPVRRSADVRPSPVRLSADVRPSPVRLSADVRPSPVRLSADVRPSPVRLSADVRPSPVRLSADVRPSAVRGSADIRPSPIRGSDSLLNERGKVTGDSARYTESYLDRDFRRYLFREDSVGNEDIRSSPYRRSVSVTKEDQDLTHGSALPSKFSLKDYEKKYQKKYPMEFGGRFGTLLLILLLPFYIMSVFEFNLVPDPTKFEVLFQKQLVLIFQAAIGIIMVLFVQAVLTIVPIGTVASGPLTKLGILNMRCNGIFAALFTFILISAPCYFEGEVVDIIVSVYSEAAVSALLLGIVFSIILYRRAGKLPISYLNPYGSTGYKWYDFWMGREVTPCIGKFNVKLVLHRFSLIIAIALNVLIVVKAYFLGVEEDVLKSLMISAVFQSLYCLHFLFHEDIYLYSFLAISEGVGYMHTVGFMTFPFMLTFTTKAILDYRLKASLTEIGIALCAYTIGYLLLESSSNRKTRSVRDPVTSVWKMKMLPEWSTGVQTRAYTGEIIIYWAFAMVAGTTYLGLSIIPTAFTLCVLSRALREYKRSSTFQAGGVNTTQK